MYGGKHTAPNEAVSLAQLADPETCGSNLPFRALPRVLACKVDRRRPSLWLEASSLFRSTRDVGEMECVVISSRSSVSGCQQSWRNVEAGRGSHLAERHKASAIGVSHAAEAMMPRLISSAVTRVETRRSCLAKTLLCSTSAGKTARHYAPGSGHATERRLHAANASSVEQVHALMGSVGLLPVETC